MNTRIMNFIDKSNRILFFCAAIFAIIALGWGILSNLLRDAYSEPQVQVIKQDDNQESTLKATLETKYMGKIKDVHILEVTSDQIIEANVQYFQSPSSFYPSSNAVNLMFTKTGEKNKLLLDDNALIVSFSPTQINKTEYQYALNKNLYTVAKTDSNNDGFLNEDDKKDMFVSEYDGSKLTPIMSDIQGYEIIQSNSVVITKATKKGMRYYTYNVESGELLLLDTEL